MSNAFIHSNPIQSIRDVVIVPIARLQERYKLGKTTFLPNSKTATASSRVSKENAFATKPSYSKPHLYSMSNEWIQPILVSADMPFPKHVLIIPSVISIIIIA